MVVLYCRDWILLDCSKECWWLCFSSNSVRPKVGIVVRALGISSAIWSVLGSQAAFSLPSACVLRSQVETSVTFKHGIWSLPSLALLFLVFLLRFCQPGSSYQKNGGLSIHFGCPPLTSTTGRLRPSSGLAGNKKNRVGEGGACLPAVVCSNH